MKTTAKNLEEKFDASEEVLDYFDLESAQPLEDMEDTYLAEKRIQDIKKGKVQTVPLENVMKRYDMGS